MNLLAIWQESLLSAWAQVAPGIVALFWMILGAAVVFVVALLVAYWGRRVVEEILRAVQFEQLSETSGFAAFLKRADIKLTATELVGELIRWVIVLVGFIAAVNILGLTPVVDVLLAILGYVPSVFAAALILAAGFIVAKIADGIVRGALATVDHDAARPVGKLAYWVVLVLAFFAALDQLKIAPALTESVFQTISWASALAIGLLVGLGAKDLISKILLDWYDKVRK